VRVRFCTYVAVRINTYARVGNALK
jgi:hypothetical protein